jgi:flotillin
VPLLEQVAYLSLNIISIPLRIQRAYTKEGVAVTVEAVANVKIAGDDVSLRGAAERFLGMPPDQIKGVIFQTLEGHLARNSRHADGRGNQRRPAGVRAEDDR